MIAPRIEVYCDPAGNHRWRLFNRIGELMCVGPERYTRDGCIESLERFLRAVQVAEIVEVGQ